MVQPGLRLGVLPVALARHRSGVAATHCARNCELGVVCT